MLKRLLLTIFLTLFAQGLHAATVYVDNTTTSCSTPSDTDYDPTTDTCGGGGTYTVYSTIDAAVQSRSSGDTVLIAAGTYSEGDIDNPPDNITVRGEDSTRANWPVFTPTDQDAFIWNGVDRPLGSTFQYIKISFVTRGSGYACFRNSGGTTVKWTVLDFECIGSGGNDGSTAAGFHFGLAGNGIRVARGYIAEWSAATSDPDNNPGVHCFYVKGFNNTVENNYCENTNGLGLQIYDTTGGTGNNIVRYNTFKNTGKTGIFCGSGTGNQCYNNILIDNSNGISAQGNSPKIYHNTIYSPSANGINVSTSTASVRNNLIDSEGGTAVNNSSGASDVGDNYVAAPGFVDAASGNFNLATGSGAIDGCVAITNFSSGRYVGAAPDCGALESPIRSAAVADNTNEWVVTFSMPSQSTPPPAAVGLQSCDQTDFAMRENTAALAESACTVIATNQVKLTITEALTGGTTLDDSYTQPASGALQDSVSIGDPNQSGTHLNAWVRSWSQQSATNNVAGAPAVTWTVVGWRCLSYYADSTPASTDWLRAENASPTTAPCLIKAGGKGLVVLSLRASGANPDATTFEWMANYDGGAYADMTNTSSATTLAFLGANPPAMNDLSTFTCLLSVSTPCATGVVITQQASQPSVDAAENDEFEVILAVQSNSATTVGKQLCIKAALAGSDETSVTQTTPPCFQIVNAASGF